MRRDILLKIRENKGLKEYLEDNSYWYILLNRNPKNYDIMLKKYKKEKKEKDYNKIETTIDNIELLANLIKYVD